MRFDDQTIPAVSGAPPPAPSIIPLAYSSPRQPDPIVIPRRLVVIGVISVIWGASLLALNFHGGRRMYGRYQDSIPPPPLPRPTVVIAAIAPYDDDFVREKGLKGGDRKIVCDELHRVLGLPADRRIILDRFLSDAGQEVFGPPPLENSAVAKAIERMDRPSEGRDGAGEQSPHLAMTRFGTLEINNNLVRFTPRSGDVIVLEGNYFSPRPNVDLWGAQALEEWLRKMGRSSPLTAEQAATILHQASLIHATPLNRREDNYYFGTVPMLFGGAIYPSTPTLQIEGRNLLLLYDGTLVQRQSLALTARGTLVSKAIWFDQYSRPETYPFVPAMPGSLAAIRIKVLESVAQAALGLLLLIAGLLTLMRRPGAARLHRLAALLRFPAMVAFLAVVGWYMSSLSPPWVLRPSWLQASWLQDAVWHSISVAYAIVVLIVMRSPPVREHYAWRREEMVFFTAQARRRWRQLLCGNAGRAMVFLLGLAAAVAAMAQAWALMQQGSLMSSHLPGTALMVILAMVAFLLLLIPAPDSGGSR